MVAVCSSIDFIDVIQHKSYHGLYINYLHHSFTIHKAFEITARLKVKKKHEHQCRWGGIFSSNQKKEENHSKQSTLHPFKGMNFCFVLFFFVVPFLLFWLFFSVFPILTLCICS